MRHTWKKNEVLDLFDLPFSDLLFKAQVIHRKYFSPNEVQISSLLSIKTGGCTENCKYCAQSADSESGVKATKLMNATDVAEKAKQAKKSGASRFCMGAAWKNPKDRDIPKLVKIIENVKKEGVETCMTLGMLTKKQSQELKKAGLDYYNHNIDTSEKFYSNIITSHSFQERIDTINNVMESGINVCSGGIIGIGESVEDRAMMLQTLANLPEHPKSIPINLLVEIKGTNIKNSQPDNFDFIKTIAVARILMPKSYVRLAAGRESMNDEMQALCFLAGANSIFYGEELLTTANVSEEKDQKLFERLGINGLL